MLGKDTNWTQKTGAAAAENGGAAASIDKNGHWAVQSRVGAYADNIVPWECTRVLAGFSPAPNSYYLQRNLLEPPQLKHMRIVILQDAACLMDMDDYKSHPMWNHGVFTS